VQKHEARSRANFPMVPSNNDRLGWDHGVAHWPLIAPQPDRDGLLAFLVTL